MQRKSSRVNHHLHPDQRELVNTEKKGHGDELVGFDIPGAGVCKLSAKIYSGDECVEELHLPDIIIPAYTLIPPKPAQKIKNLKGHLALVKDQDNYLEVKFYENGLNKLKNEDICHVPIFYQLRRHIRFAPRFTRNEIKGMVKIPPILDEFSHFYKLEANIPKDQLLELAQEIEKLGYVEYCDLLSESKYPPPMDNINNNDLAPPSHDVMDSSPEAELPLSSSQVEASEAAVPLADSKEEDEQPAQASPPTPNFTNRQGYLDAGFGMNIRAAWVKGTTGKNITFRYAGFGIENEHEDLKNSVIVHDNRPPGNPEDDREHGTAGVGTVRANNNGFGVTGIAYDCDTHFYETTTENLDKIIGHFRPGDIISLNIGHLIRLQPLLTVPIVHRPSWWTRISLLTEAGASSQINGQRLAFSNHNLHLALNSWGQNVATTGYGDLQDYPPVPLRNYTSTWGGTSSATPLIAGALTLVQSYAKNKYSVILNTWDMLKIIQHSASREALGLGIGVRPNVAEALKDVDYFVSNGTLPPGNPPPPPYPAWKLNVQYEVGDRVSYQGENYECLMQHFSISTAYSPVNYPPAWLKITTPQRYPEWAIGVRYEAGERVTHLNLNYQCLWSHQSSSLSSPPFSPGWWGLVVD